MPKDRDPNEPIKVTDKRIFTATGEIKDEYLGKVNPVADPPVSMPPDPAVQATPPPPQQEAEKAAEPKKRVRDRAEDPGTAFSKFAQSLIIQAYMSLGLLANRYQPGAPPDLAAAKELIDILTMLAEKTSNNLSEDEDDFLKSHLGELKLAFVRSRTP